MDDVNLTLYLVGFLEDTIYLAGIPLLVATVVALTVAVLQAMTQVQDQNLSQTIKIAAIVLVFMTLGASLVQPLLLRTERLFSEIERF
jgi:type III secretion protein S